MGGKKKPTISQLAKKAEKQAAQQKQAKQAKKEEAQAKRTIELLDERIFDSIARDIQNMPVVTPYEISAKYGIKMSLAIKVLRNLRQKGDLALISKGHRTEIYAPTKRP